MQIRKNTRLNDVVGQEKANLESKKSIFLQIGFIISLAFVLVAFEWRTPELEKVDWDMYSGIPMDIDLYEVKAIEEKPEPKMMKLIAPIFVIDEEDLPNEDFEVDAEVSDETENSLDNRKEFNVEETETEDNFIYDFVQKKPQFPGGEVALYAFLKDNLVYPKNARDIGLIGKVHVEFIVWKDGTIRNVKILRSIGGGCDEEVVRVINKMPRWEPGMQGVEKVNVYFRMPVSFKLR